MDTRALIDREELVGRCTVRRSLSSWSRGFFVSFQSDTGWEHALPTMI